MRTPMKNSAKPLAIYSVSAGLMAGLPIFVLPFIANAIGPESFGLFSTARFTMQLFTLFSGSFLGFGLARIFYENGPAEYYAKLNGANLTTFIFATLLFTIFSLGFLIAENPFAELMKTAGNPSSTQLLFVVLVGSLFFVMRQNYHRIIVMAPRPWLAALSELMYNITLFGMFLVAVSLDRGWFDLLIVQTTVFAFTTFTTAIIVVRLKGTRGIFGLDQRWMMDNLKRSSPFFVVGLVTPLLLTLDKYIIAGILGLEAMGQYASTSLYLSGVFLLSGVFQKVYVPETYKLLSQYQEEKSDQTRRLLMHRLRLVLLMIIPLIAAIALGAQIHASLFFDANYLVAINITWIVTLAGASSFVQIALIPFFDSFAKSRQMSIIAFTGLAISFIALAYGAQNFGLTGAAVGLLIGQLLYIMLILMQFVRLKSLMLA